MDSYSDYFTYIINQEVMEESRWCDKKPWFIYPDIKLSKPLECTEQLIQSGLQDILKISGETGLNQTMWALISQNYQYSIYNFIWQKKYDLNKSFELAMKLSNFIEENDIEGSACLMFWDELTLNLNPDLNFEKYRSGPWADKFECCLEQCLSSNSEILQIASISGVKNIRSNRLLDILNIKVSDHSLIHEANEYAEEILIEYS